MPRKLGQSRARAALGAICERIRGRTPIVSACALEGVPRSTFYELLEADDEAAALVEQARAFAAQQDEIELRTLISEEKRTANVMLNLMERLYPDRYGAKQRVEIDARVRRVEDMSDDELIREAARIAEKHAARLTSGDDSIEGEYDDD